MTQQFHSKLCTWEKWVHVKDREWNVQSDSIHNKQKLEASQMHVSRRTDKQSRAYLARQMLLSNKKELFTPP